MSKAQSYQADSRMEMMEPIYNCLNVIVCMALRCSGEGQRLNPQDQGQGLKICHQGFFKTKDNNTDVMLKYCSILRLSHTREYSSTSTRYLVE